MDLNKVKDKFKNLLNNAINKVNQLKDKKAEYEQNYDEMVKNVNKATDNYFSAGVGKNKMEIDVTRFNRDNIIKLAEKILEDDYVEKKEDAKNTLENTLAKQNEKIAKSQEDFRQDVERVNEKADASNVELNDKALKNNVARSSAVMLTKKEIEDSKQGAIDSLEDKLSAQLDRANTINQNAQETFDRVDKEIEDEHDTLMDENIKKLYAKKHSNSQYDKQQVNKELASVYSDNIVKIISDFLISLNNKPLAKTLLETNEFIVNSTTEKEREALLGMIS